MAEWDKSGILDRETAIYAKWAAGSDRVTLVSYGGRSEKRFADRLGGVEVISNRWGLPRPVYLKMVAREAKQWTGRVVIRSNQTPGAQHALKVAGAAGHPFIARCGYLFSLNTERAHGSDSDQARRALALERRVFQGADRVMVTTPEMRLEAINRHDLDPDRVAVVPNYVRTDLFAPDPTKAKKEGRICFVGRLTPEKNLTSLIRALTGLQVELVLIGDGPERERLEVLAEEVGVKVNFLGARPHGELPGILNTAVIYAQPSIYEGHPKSILEAMACGLPVIGSDGPGMREVIADGRTGLIAKTDPDSIRIAVKRLLADKRSAEALGRAAREKILAELALERIAGLEHRLFEELA